jgi:hypothetical protein
MSIIQDGTRYLPLHCAVPYGRRRKHLIRVHLNEVSPKLPHSRPHELSGLERAIEIGSGNRVDSGMTVRRAEVAHSRATSVAMPEPAQSVPKVNHNAAASIECWRLEAFPCKGRLLPGLPSV